MRNAFLALFAVEPRPFWALTKAFILMDLRGQHYSRATATKPHYRFSPLFWVVGQCLTVSAMASLLLFARVDVFFFVFVNLSLSMLVIATTVLVEFNEIVLDPHDLDVIGHRPIAPRTYAAARFANLLFYVGLMYLAMNIFPLILGAGLRDAGPWYVPAYLTASLAGNLAVAALVIFALSLVGASPRLDTWKEILAWTQIALVLVLFYGGQLMLRQGWHGLQVWGAFPPGWAVYLPPTWLARFVEEAAVAPAGTTLLAGLLLALAGLGVTGVTVLWVARLYQLMQPMVHVQRAQPMPPAQVGALPCGIAAPFLRSPEERVGFWLCRTFLARDTGLKIRCIWAVNLAIVAVLLGVLSGQFANPMIERDVRLVTLSIGSLYVLALSVPAIIHQLTFTRDGPAGWLLLAAPLARPGRLARGACKAVMVLVVLPLCLLWGLIAAFAWGDVVAAALHVAWTMLLCWAMALAALWMVVLEPPFSHPLARGSSMGPLALPLAILSAAVMPLAGLHYFFAPSPWFWIAAAVMVVAGVIILGRQADARQLQLWEANR